MEEMCDIRSKRLRTVQTKLMEILDFLSDYLPLVNCHSNDFILNSHWDTFLSEPIRKELDSLSASELKCVLSEKLNTAESQHIGGTSLDCDSVTWKFRCEYLEKAKTGSDVSEIYTPEMQKISPHWVHENLHSFLRDAQKCHLQNSGILSPIENQDEDINIPPQDTGNVFISTFMNQKKTHEVDVMGEMCYRLAQKYDINKVVDLGSGKGYLSTQLAFQHKLCVIGVDAQNINTKGASKRADILSRQWDGLTRNEVLRAEKTGSGKLGKKKKKLLKKTEHGGDIQPHEEVEKSTDLCSAISDEVYTDFSSFFEEQEGTVTDKTSHHSSGGLMFEASSPKENLPFSVSSEEKAEVKGQQERKTSNAKVGIDTECIDCERFSSDRRFTAKKQNAKSSKLKANHFPVTMYIHTDSDLSEIVDRALDLNPSDDRSVTSAVRRSTEGTGVSVCTNPSEIVDRALDLNPLDDRSETSAVHRSTEGTGVSVCTNPTDGQKVNRESVMLTGLHTCGGLGSSILRLFVNSREAHILCNVACCYHLMKEEFVASPFEEKDDTNEAPGFPLSNFLRKNKVGIGRQARNLGSQSVDRRAHDTEVLAKQFPRMLLQVILQDQLGYVKSDWKGLRKLDQKSDGMFDYVIRAFTKLGVSTEGISEELVTSYCRKYEDQKRKFAAFFQLKTALAPCIEAVILLDRLCFLLEQEFVKDAKLLQLFDPVMSPRCYGIVAVKA